MRTVVARVLRPSLPFRGTFRIVRSRIFFYSVSTRLGHCDGFHELMGGGKHGIFIGLFLPPKCNLDVDGT